MFTLRYPLPAHGVDAVETYATRAEAERAADDARAALTACGFGAHLDGVRITGGEQRVNVRPGTRRVFRALSQLGGWHGVRDIVDAADAVMSRGDGFYYAPGDLVIESRSRRAVEIVAR